MHPSILKIKSVFTSIRLSSDGISKIIITSLDSAKKSSGVVISTKFVKLANKEICKDLANFINESITKTNFQIN